MSSKRGGGSASELEKICREQQRADPRQKHFRKTREMVESYTSLVKTSEVLLAHCIKTPEMDEALPAYFSKTPRRLGRRTGEAAQDSKAHKPRVHCSNLQRRLYDVAVAVNIPPRSILQISKIFHINQSSFVHHFSYNNQSSFFRDYSYSLNILNLHHSSR